MSSVRSNSRSRNGHSLTDDAAATANASAFAGTTTHAQQEVNINLPLPVEAQPTEVLAQRFASWRKVIRALNVYFKEVAAVQEEVVRHNIRLGHAVNFPFFTNGTSENHQVPPAPQAQVHMPSNGGQMDENDFTRAMFLEYGHGSLADIPGNVIQFHRAQAAAASRCSKELAQNVIPRLEDLRRDLLVKIKEIKSLQSDFKSNVPREQRATENELRQFYNSIELLNKSPQLLAAKHDPYLVKVQLERQLGKQVREENYLLDAFINLQNSGKELERVVVQEVQSALTVFGKLMGVQGKNLSELLSNKVLEGFVSKDAVMEWDQFVERDGNFVNPGIQSRQVKDIQYPHQDSLLAAEVKSGYLERRSKYLKSYSRAWYVLTPTFLHEFKTSDRTKDPHPVMSLSLDECQLAEDPRKGSSQSHKFILNNKSSHNGGTSHGKGHNWVFRAESEDKLNEWYSELQKLTTMGSPVQRARSQLKPSTRGGITEGTSTSQDGRAASLDEQRSRRPMSDNLEVPGGVQHYHHEQQHRNAAPTATSASAATTSSAAAATSSFDNNNNNNSYYPTPVATKQVQQQQQQQQDDMPALSSPVPSDTSGVTSTGEPYRADASEEEISRATERAVIDDNEQAAASRPQRGRFPSEVKLNSNQLDADRAADHESLHREATAFVVPSDAYQHQSESAVDDDASSVLSYDLEHPSASTYKNDDDFKPVDADLPVSVERRLTQTSHKDEGETPRMGPARKSTADEPVEEQVSKRRSSVKSVDRKKPARRATGSFGTGDDLKPLTNSGAGAGDDEALFFAGGLPKTTAGRETPAS